VKSIPIEPKSWDITTLPSHVGNIASGIDITKQSGRAVSKTDIDDYDNSNRTYQYRATLLHELISVDLSWIQFILSKFQLYYFLRNLLSITEPTVVLIFR
jgi:hypothetical protein